LKSAPQIGAAAASSISIGIGSSNRAGAGAINFDWNHFLKIGATPVPNGVAFASILSPCCPFLVDP
jgi:hypothetical protein